jgi:hypothetical protein
MYYLAAILMLILSSCDEDDIISYFKCEVNGEQYKTYNPIIRFSGTNLPHTLYNQSEENSYFSFYTTFSPVDESINSPSYLLRYQIFLNTPLKIGEKYSFSALPGKEHPITQQEINQLTTDKISYVTLCLSGDYWDNLSFGSGHIRLTEISEDNYWIKGIVEFEFVSPIEEEGKREQLKLKGEFRSILNISF